MLLEDRFREFLETCRGQSESNRRNYERRLKRFLDLHGGKPPGAITAADINAWHRELQRRGLAPATLAGYRQALKALFNYCVEMGDVARSPAAHLKIGSFATSRNDKLPQESHVQQVTVLARAWTHSDSPREIRDGLIWLLSLQSGPRLSEIRNLLLADVQASLERGPDPHGVFRVATTGKTGRVQIRFAGEVAQAFQVWLAARPSTRARQCFVATRPTAVVDGAGVDFGPLTRSAATRIYQRICATAGVHPPILSHALRHRLGHLTTRQFGPKVAAILLNHRDWHRSATAIAFYHHPDEEDASRAVVTGGLQDDGSDELTEMRRLFGLD